MRTQKLKDFDRTATGVYFRAFEETLEKQTVRAKPTPRQQSRESNVLYVPAEVFRAGRWCRTKGNLYRQIWVLPSR